MTSAGSEPREQYSAGALPVRIAAVAMVIDALLLIAHILHVGPPMLGSDGSWPLLLRSAALWNGALDGSLLEIFGLLQLGAAAVLILVLGLQGPSHRVLIGWGGILLLLVADDLFRIHEQMGARLASYQFAPSMGPTTAQEFGGLVFWAASGFVLVIGLIYLHLGSTRTTRSQSWTLLVTVVPFIVVAVGYVLVGVARPGLLDGHDGVVVALVRITVKLLTMTLLFVHALRFYATRR